MQFRSDGSLDVAAETSRLRLRAAIRWAAIGSLFIVGAIVVAEAASYNIYAATLLNIGTAIALVGLLLYAERQIVERVKSSLPLCPLADPPSQLVVRKPLNGPDVLACSHQPPHRWNAVTGERL